MIISCDDTVLQVNNNGVISFTTAVSEYTLAPLPLPDNFQLIAPYWADVDTRGTGAVWYRMTTDTELLMRTRQWVQTAFIDQSKFSPTSLFIATWEAVGYYSNHTDLVRVTCT